MVERSGEIVVRRLDDDRVLARLPGPERVDFWHACPLFSPDGDLLVAVYVRTGGPGKLLRVWHLGRRELVGSLPSRTVDPFSARIAATCCSFRRRGASPSGTPSSGSSSGG